MRYSGNPVMVMPHSRNECPVHSKRIPYPNERDANRSYSSKSCSKPPYEEPKNLRIENTVCYKKDEENKKNPLFTIFNYDICLDDLILIGLIIILFLDKGKKSDNDCVDNEKDKDKDKGLFGLGDDLILIIALGYLLLDNFL